MLASKNMGPTSLYVDKNDYAIIKKISKRTRVPVSHFMREALRSVIIKYKAFTEGEKDVDLTAYVAAPATFVDSSHHNKQTIRPHEGLSNPVTAEIERALEAPTPAPPGIESTAAWQVRNGLPVDVGDAFLSPPESEPPAPPTTPAPPPDLDVVDDRPFWAKVPKAE